ncbi:unnamed protein product [Diabrotica balteata]|uniref:E3 ubiquitin-protein ligase CHFR n=1 Tax=Diabrotica balteata TaxID=107213 RepID=A0A9N9XDB9_DIABA|nr:unnamed protein product [Diabrotica balteata]
MDPGNPFLVNNSNLLSIPIDKNPFTIGRGLNCNYVIANTIVSREHCCFEKTENGWCLRDKSTNGTYVNQNLIRGTLSDPLKSADVIQISEHHRFTFRNCSNDYISDEQLCRIADTVLGTIEVDSNTSLSVPPREPLTGTLQLDVYPDCSVSHPIRDPVSDCFQPSKRLKTINLKPSTSVSSVSTATTSTFVDLTDENFTIEVGNICVPSTSTNDRGVQPATFIELDDSIEITSTTAPSTAAEMLAETIFAIPFAHSDQSSIEINSQTPCTSDTNMGQIESHRPEGDNMEQVESHRPEGDNMEQVESHRPEGDNKMMSESQMENELQCAICAEMFVKASTLNCSHTFCKFCIDKWKEKQTICPICRTKITSQVPTLVLDNFIEKIVQGSGQDIQNHRKELLDERMKQQQQQQQPQQQPQQLFPRRPMRGRRVQVAIEAVPDDQDTDESSSSSDTTSTMSDSGQEDTEWEDNYWNDDWYVHFLLLSDLI